MSDFYKKTLLRLASAQICSTIGYNSTQNTALELLQDVLNRYLFEFSRDLLRHVDHYNRTEPHMKDVLLTFRNLKISLKALKEFVENVEHIPFILDIPKYPLKKVIDFRFSRNGLEDARSRPIYVYEYLPPFIQCDEDKKIVKKRSNFESMKGESKSSDSNLQSKNVLSNKICSREDSQSFSMKQVQSAIMTTTGYISPAVEGRIADALLPEEFAKWRGLDAPPPALSVQTAGENISNICNEESVVSGNNNDDKNSADPIKTKPQSDVCAEPPVSNLVAQTTTNNMEEKIKCSEESTAKRFPKKSSLKKLKKRESIKGLQILSEYSEHKTSKVIPDQTDQENDMNKVTAHSNAILSKEATQLDKLLRKKERMKNKVSKKKVKQSLEFSKQSILNISGSFGQEPLADAKDILLGSSTFQTTMLNSQSPIDVSTSMQSSKIVYDLISSNNGAVNLHDNRELEMKTFTAYDSKKLSASKKASKHKSPHCYPPLSAKIESVSKINLIERALEIQPIINLPSGTTITPAPHLNFSKGFSNLEQNINNDVLSNILDGTPQCNSLKINEDETIKNANAPPPVPPPPEVPVKKKRGRKPGSKNNPKPVLPTGLFNLLPINNFFKENCDRQMSTPPINMNPQYMSYLNEDHSDKSTFSGMKNFEPVSVPFIDRKKNKNSSNNFHVPENFHKNSNEQHIIDVENMSKSSNKFMENKDTEDQQLLSRYSFLESNNMQATTALGFPQKLPEYNTNDLRAPFPVMPMFSFPSAPGLIPPSPKLFSSNEFAKFNHLSPSLFSYSDFKDKNINLNNINNAFEGVCNMKQQERLPNFNDASFCNVAPLIPDFLSLKSNTKPINELNFNDPVKVELYKGTGSINNGVPIKLNSEYAMESENLLNYDRKKTKIAPHPNLATIERNRNILAKSINYSGTAKRQQNVIDKKINQSQKSVCEPIELSDDSNDAKTMHANSKTEIDQVQQPASFKRHYDSISDIRSMEPAPKNEKKIKKSAKLLKSNFLPNPNFCGGQIFKDNCGNNFGKLAGGADLIPLLGSNTGLAYSSKSIPPTSLTANAFNANEIKLSEEKAPNILCAENMICPTPAAVDLEICSTKRKDLKKHKKLKDGKLKKKKEKKEKLKMKETETAELQPNEQEKNILRKQKKERKKIKQHMLTFQNNETDFKNNQEPSIKDSNNSLKINESPDVKKPTIKAPSAYSGTELSCAPSENLKSSSKTNKELDGKKSSPLKEIKGDLIKETMNWNPSPELARISPLITRPPKHKSGSVSVKIPVPLGLTSQGEQSNEQTCAELPPPSPWHSGGTLTASSVLLPQQLLNAPKRTASSHEEPNNDNESSTCFKSSYVDSEGNTIWICPACGKIDDGSPMIGCDGCDAWYHWICVNITVAPSDNEDWFCNNCKTKRGNCFDKKKKRNKKK